MKKRNFASKQHLSRQQLDHAGGGFAFLAPLLPYAPAAAGAMSAIAMNPAAAVRGMSSAAQFGYDAYNWVGDQMGSSPDYGVGWDFGA
jgi:hypothetical protein